MKIFLSLAAALTCGLAQAQNASGDNLDQWGDLIYQKTLSMYMEVSEATVVAIPSDFVEYPLKIYAPSLNFFTLLDHTDYGDSTPSIGVDRQLAEKARQTNEFFSVEDVVQDNPGVDVISVTLQVRRKFQKAAGECRVQIYETVSATIRGIPFSNTESSSTPARMDSCE